MHKWLEKSKSAVFLAFCIVFASSTFAATAETSVVYTINSTKVSITNQTVDYSIVGSSTPVYTVTERFSPFRVVIDVAGATFGESVTSETAQIPDNKLVSLTISDLNNLETPVKRFVFTLADSQDYSVAAADSSLQVKIYPTAIANQAQSTAPKAPAAAKAQYPSVTDPTLDALIVSSEQLMTQDPATLTSNDASSSETDSAQDAFSFSGFKKKRISVDFYKIDIHNVFRLFRQITDLNIIVDEGVSGSLTLALSDVPWDFALDVILNLMDLKKEERFNTIVIYPKSKEFMWPERTEDNLAFEESVEIIEQESLIIEQSSSQSEEILKAKELLVKAQNFEKKDDYEEAVAFYTEAFEIWPDNPKIANKLATIYLVHLGMNAKAVHYAKENLKMDPQNRHAALYAAIGSANMQRIAEASDYFAQSTSGNPPMKEALLSYAAFSENNGQNEATLKLIEKYHSYYGETVDTMITKARVLDKMGKTEAATKQYVAILTSGFQIRPDLKKYISVRVADKN